MKNFNISVIIPSYNHQKFLSEAIESVLNQEDVECELIIIDDGSKDDSPQIAKAWQNRYPDRVQVIVQQNAGAHNTINRGLKLSQSKYLTILNSDDIFVKNRLKLFYQIAEGTQKDFLFSKVKWIGEHSEFLPEDHWAMPWYQGELKRVGKWPTVGFDLLGGNFSVTTSNYFFSKAHYEKVGDFMNYRLSHDYDFILRSLLVTEPIFIRDELLYYRIHGSNTVLSQRELLVTEGDDILRKYLRLSDSSENRLAPSLSNWGQYFKTFIETQRVGYTSELKLIKDLL